MKRKIVFMTYDFPFPTNSGGKVRAYNLLKCAQGEFDIRLFSFTRNNFNEKYNKEFQSIGIEDITLLKRRSLKDIHNISSLIYPNSSIFKSLYFSQSIQSQLLEYVEKEKIEVIHFESFYTSYYLNKQLQNMGVKQVYGTENIEYKNYEDFTNKLPSLINIPFKLQVKKIRNEEVNAARIADITLAVTQEEADYFAKVGAKKTEVVPNGVDTELLKFQQNTTPHGSKILFVGNFSYFPNKDGIQYFYSQVFNKLSGNYRLIIVGKDATKLGIHDPRVELNDYIDDIKDAYYNADVMISPIRIGGGSNFKVIEAMACGLPVIADSARIKSLHLVPDEHLLVADNAETFIKKLEILLNNDALQGRIAKSAREHIEKNYSWKVIGKKMRDVWKNI